MHIRRLQSLSRYIASPQMETQGPTFTVTGTLLIPVAIFFVSNFKSF